MARRDRALAVAHRGTPRAFRDNTVAGIAEAVRLGADAVEVDVRVTADDVAVLHHDPALSIRSWLRHPGRPRRVTDLTWEELRTRAPWVPTLAQGLAAAGEVPLVLDVGSVPVARACLEAADPRAVTHPWFCGDARALAWVRTHRPSATLLLSWERGGRPPGDLPDPTAPTYVNPAHRLLDARAVREWHARGLRVCTWTVDSRARRRRLLDWGVDALISNDVEGVVRDCADSGRAPA